MSPAIRMRKAEREAHRDAMLDKYVAWLNLWAGEMDGNSEAYTTDNFIHGRSDYAHDQFIVAYETNYYLAVVYNVDDGDEGGGHTLTGYFHRHELPGHAVATIELRVLIQEFDTMIQVVWAEGNFLNTPDG